MEKKMITFNCDRLNLILLADKLNFLLHPTDRKHYYELRQNNYLIGHWNEISNDGELMMSRFNKGALFSNKWMPIETAPNDDSFYAADIAGRYYIGSMIDGIFHNASGSIPPYPPTHWMPLPPSPAAIF